MMNTVISVLQNLYILQNFPLKIKWPNDLYYGRMCKVGGLIVNATTINDKTVCTIGKYLNFGVR